MEIDGVIMTESAAIAAALEAGRARLYSHTTTLRTMCDCLNIEYRYNPPRRSPESVHATT